DGKGVPGLFPPLSGNANVQQLDPTTAVHFVLTGASAGPTDAKPTPFGMPSFAWKLTDDQIAAVLTYVRNMWGNMAPDVSAGQVKTLRGKLNGTAPEIPIVVKR